MIGKFLGSIVNSLNRAAVAKEEANKTAQMANYINSLYFKVAVDLFSILQDFERSYLDDIWDVKELYGTYCQNCFCYNLKFKRGVSKTENLELVRALSRELADIWNMGLAEFRRAYTLEIVGYQLFIKIR